LSDLPKVWPGFIQVEETKFQAAVSEYVVQKLGQALNSLKQSLNFIKVEFTTPGVTSWTVPAGVTTVIVECCGGGGGGLWGTTPGSGGAGAAFVKRTLTGLTPGTVISVTIGAAGPGGSNGTNGGNGGNTIFGSYITAFGAPGGLFGLIDVVNNLDPYGGAYGGGLIAITPQNGFGQNGYKGGVPNSSFAGGGGAGPYGNGGNGAVFGVSPAQNGQGYGAGGGSGTTGSGTSGSGGSGYLALFYLST